MGLFGRKAPEETITIPAGARGNPFAAIPIVAEEAEAHENEKGCIEVRRELPPKPGMATYLRNKFGMKKVVGANLDEQGTFFWYLIDGKRPLHEIENRLRREYKLEAQESKNATVAFTKLLMMRHLISLQLPIKGKRGGK